jgi:Na+-transporting NADH:ubiquinone oxidoreductase subunit C
MSDHATKPGFRKTIVFAWVMCMVCGSLLTLASTGLKGYQQKNVALDQQKNILRTVNLIQAAEVLSPDEIAQRYHDNIRPASIDDSGALADENEKNPHNRPVYLYGSPTKPKAYIIPINSRGLWGKILGYIAMENDGVTIAGFTVYSHSETPGLGGEIEKLWFSDNFKGKKIIDTQGNFVSVGIAKGKVAESIPLDRASNYVDGISGATLTGKFLSAGLKQVLKEYEPFAKKFRTGEQPLVRTQPEQ